MEQLLDKSIYLTLPPRLGNRSRRVSQLIIKITPVRIEFRHKGKNGYLLYTKELVDAEMEHAIATHDDWSVSWGVWDNENQLNYYFANYWHAYAFSLRLQEFV